jgi:hypothetical protein
MSHLIYIPIQLAHTITSDPTTLPQHNLAEESAARCIFVCESLFRATQLLGMAQPHCPEQRFSETLENIGELGQAFAVAAYQQLEILITLNKECDSEQER